MARSTARKVRMLGALAFVLSLAVTLMVLLGLREGGWPLFVPVVAAASVVAWPTRPMVIVAVILNAAIVVLGLMTVGILYGFSLAALIHAFALLRPIAKSAPA
jgi:hypothetical protein